MADPYYSLSVHRVDAGRDGRDTAVLRLGGDLDINARDDLRDALLAAAGDPRGGALVVDLAAVSFLDSEAMNALLNGCTAATGNGRPVRLTGAQGMVHRVLSISGVLDLVETLNRGAVPERDAQSGVLRFPDARPAAEE